MARMVGCQYLRDFELPLVKLRLRGKLYRENNSIAVLKAFNCLFWAINAKKNPRGLPPPEEIYSEICTVVHIFDGN